MRGKWSWMRGWGLAFVLATIVCHSPSVQATGDLGEIGVLRAQWTEVLAGMLQFPEPDFLPPGDLRVSTVQVRMQTTLIDPNGVIGVTNMHRGLKAYDVHGNDITGLGHSGGGGTRVYERVFADGQPASRSFEVPIGAGRDIDRIARITWSESVLRSGHIWDASVGLREGEAGLLGPNISLSVMYVAVDQNRLTALLEVVHPDNPFVWVFEGDRPECLILGWHLLDPAGRVLRNPATGREIYFGIARQTTYQAGRSLVVLEVTHAPVSNVASVGVTLAGDLAEEEIQVSVNDIPIPWDDQ